MSLPDPRPRRRLLTREIRCEAFERDDDCIDIEGTLTDTRDFPVTNPWRGTVPPGGPLHLMQVRVTIDREGVIREIIGETAEAPYPGLCQQGVSNLQRLVGLTVGPGFNRRVPERVGHTAGCTHVVTLLQAMAHAAIAALASRRHLAGEGGMLETFRGRAPGEPPLIDTCVAYAADGPVVKVLYPQYHKTRSES